MKKIIRTIVIASLSIAAFSCEKKYEDGPTVSVLSRKERVANDWKIQKAIENGTDISEDYDQYDLYLTKNGDLSAYSWAFARSILALLRSIFLRFIA